MSKKYILTDDTIVYQGVTLHRIKAVKDINGVSKDTLGGYIEKESNLSHEGNCWVDCDSKVLGGVQIQDSARIYNSIIYGSILIKDGSLIMDSSIKGSGYITENSNIEQSNILGVIIIKNSSINKSKCSDSSLTVIDSYIENSYLDKSIGITRSTIEHSSIGSNASIFNTTIYNTDINEEVYLNYATLENAGLVNKSSDVLVFKNTWSSLRFFTYHIPSKKFFVGCFKGTGKELIEKAYKDSELSGKMYEKYVKFAENELTTHL